MKRTRLAALAIAVGLACAGCSDDDPEPKFSPSESPSPTPTETETTSDPPEPEEPAMPEIAKMHTAKGAEAFVRHYWAMAEYAQISGDTSGLERLANDRCKACIAGVDYLNEVFAAGGTIQGGSTRVSDIQSDPFSFGDSSGFEVRARVHNTKQTVTYPNDKKNESYPAGVITTHFFVEWTSNGWLVALWEQT